jgi:hypothetical protein
LGVITVHVIQHCIGLTYGDAVKSTRLQYYEITSDLIGSACTI